MKSLCLSAALAASLAVPALAAEPYIGAWAQTAAACKSEPLFTIAPGKFTASAFACEDAAYTKDGKNWRAVLMQCAGEDSDKPLDLAARLAVEDGKLQMFWKDGTKSARLVKCRRGEL